MPAKLLALFDDIFQFMDEHPALTGTTRIQLSPELKASIQAQATRAMMSGKVLLALLGKNITLEDFLSPRLFFSESGSRAGHLLYTLIQVLQRWELGLKAGTTNMGTRPAALFPFFDLIPWPRHEFATVLCDFLGQYLRIICPLIVMSCSHLTSSVLSANLMHDRGLPRTGFLNETGRPRLCNVMDPAQYENQPAGDDIRDQDLNIIVVPALHPGRDKYGPQPESLRRVMLLTLQVAVALADIARSVIDGDMSRVDLQTHILAKWNTTPEYKALAKALEEAKVLLQADWDKTNVSKRRIVTNQEREVRAFNAQTRAKAFVAEGPPRSAVRTAQALRLWRLNHPDLHLYLGRGQQDDWFDWAHSLAEGKSFFPPSVARAGGGGLARLCAQLQPGADASDPVVQQTVIEQAVERLRAGWKEDPFSSEKQAKRRLGWRKTGGLVETLNNLPVSVQARGRIVLGFKAGEDEFVNVELWASKTAVPDGRAIRKITATPDGINLLDEAGNVFKHDVSHIATWSKVDIGRRQNGAFLIKAWEATVKQPFRSSGTPKPSALVIPAAYFGTKNTKSGFKNITDLRQAAPEPNEVDWIMWSFL
ncbi:hypothetical protein OC845_006787 [Tilletia horrida]|nr:hypothetical protein OC845_006787 [Tilletia horrida]